MLLIGFISIAIILSGLIVGVYSEKVDINNSNFLLVPKELCSKYIGVCSTKIKIKGFNNESSFENKN